MTDADITQAVESLTSRVKLREAAIRDGEDVPDAEVFAREFITAMTGHGWRPTEAKVYPAWKPPAGGGSAPPAGLLADLRADLAAKAEAARHEREAQAEGPDAA